jgi:pyrimidine operon attenuation protein/uracil phosphoribosyltransferase
MPFKVIFFRQDTKIGSKVWKTKTEAVAHTERTPLEIEATSVIIVDDDTNEIVFSGRVRTQTPPDQRHLTA